MKNLTALFCVALTLCGVAHAEKFEFFGPMPHERTNTPKKANANVGRYMYIGTMPKFTGEEIELTVSKMSLTVRATGWISQARRDGYASELYQRYERISAALEDPDFVLHPLIQINSIPTRDTSIAWAKIASQYSAHILENRGVEIYTQRRNAKSLAEAGKTAEYTASIKTAILRYFFNNNSLTSEAVESDNLLRDNLLSVDNSRALFAVHNKTFVSSAAKPGYIGNITAVYPIAATTAGPFDQPKEGVRRLLDHGTIDARWWSDKWNDEFGGLPFILINSAGVAFHGPITNFAPLDVWYLRRGYVSHGCHRMDVSDISELRAMMPTNIKELGRVKLTVLNHFDVTDWNNDGNLEVVDVKFYNVPGAVTIANGQTIDQAIQPYLVANQMKTFFSTNPFSKKFYDVASDTIKGAPKYKVSNGVLLKDGVHGDLPLARFDYPASRVLQYKELDVQMVPYDDNRGKFPPKYFFN